jgi:hypothetical protein
MRWYQLCKSFIPLNPPLPFFIMYINHAVCVFLDFLPLQNKIGELMEEYIIDGIPDIG